MSLAIPVISYNFGIVEWTKSELRKVDSITRKLLTLYGALHPRANTNRLYLPRREGGRGMTNVETMQWP